METLRAILARPASSVLLFFVFWILLNWPVMLIAESRSGFALINYCFAVWAGMVAIMFVKSLLEQDAGDKGP